jgi:hypothetical protein
LKARKSFGIFSIALQTPIELSLKCGKPENPEKIWLQVDGD